MKKLVYICSPCRGDYDTNIEYAIAYSSAAFRRGVIPITPHIYFTRFANDENSKERSMAMSAGQQLLEMCAEVWVFGLDKPSEGMQAEIVLAIRRGIPIRDGNQMINSKPAENHDEIVARALAAAIAEDFNRRKEAQAWEESHGSTVKVITIRRRTQR